jgi:hypothetical protein
MKNTKNIHRVLLRFFILFFLSVSVAFAAAPQQKKHKDPKEAAQLKGCPDNSGRPNAEPTPKSPADEVPGVPLPYEPVAMTATIGMTGLVTYSNTNGVAMINPRTHTISPILLNHYDRTIDPETDAPIGGDLGSEGGGRFDLAMTSDGRQALISNFGDRKVFFVDLRSGTPVVSGMVQIEFFAEDIAIDPSNTWALVTDGGFSTRIATLHIPSRTWVPAGLDDEDPPNPISYTLPEEYIAVDDPTDPYYPGYYQGRYANSVDIASDGRTVIVTDYYLGAIHVLLLNPATGMLSYQQSVKLWKYGTDGSEPITALYKPVNSAISPDGRTVLIANAATEYVPDQPYPPGPPEGCNVAVFVIDRPGHVVRMPDVVFPNSIAGGQSIVFSPDSRRAFYETYNHDELLDFQETSTDGYFAGQEIQVLSVAGAGHVSHTGTIHTPSWRGTSQLFGVDTMVITPDGNFLYVTNPTLSGASPIIDVISLRTLTHVKSIGTPIDYPDPATEDPDDLVPPDGWTLPLGIAFPPIPPNRRPVAVIAVDKPEVILDINEVATFDGSGSHDPEDSPLTYAWSLVSAPSGAAATLVPDGAAAVLTPDPNIEGTYQVGLVVSDGTLDSTMATASVIARYYPVFPPAGITLQRLENDFIFYKEYVNRLTWTVNPENLATITAIKVYRKPKGAADSSYTLLASLAGTASGHDDKALAAEQLFTYRITAVSSRGKESDPFTVGN